jgi:hypothetical protein
MCASIVDSINQLKSEDDPIIVARFFFDSRVRDYQDACIFLSSMLLQIQKARGEVLPALSSLQQSQSKFSRRPTKIELVGTL